MQRITFDIEASGLLDDSTVDYTASPYKLKGNFQMHCIVVEEHVTGKLIAFYDGHKLELDGRRYHIEKDGYEYTLEDYKTVEYKHLPLSAFRGYISNNVCSVVAHNGINYDHLVCKLAFDMDYTCSPDSWDGREVVIEDTLVTSKTLNPDRFGGHSLDALGKKVGLRKIEFRKHIPKADRFEFFFADMLYYCIRDVQVNTKVYHWLEKQKNGWDWSDPIALEKAVAELVTRQEHRGFNFDQELAERNIKELDQLLEERRRKVEPLLPDRPATQTFLAEQTPPEKQLKTTTVVAPKLQFKKDGSIRQSMINFVEKYNGEIIGDRSVKLFDKEWELPIPEDTVLNEVMEPYDGFVNWVEKHDGDIKWDMSCVELYGVKHPLPLPREPLHTTMKAKISDSTHIKNWLVGMGWDPHEWKTRDLLTNQKKERLDQEAFEKVVEKYVEQTLASNFCKERCKTLKTKPEKLRDVLLGKFKDKVLYVRTNPSFTVGQEKEMCPDLERLSSKFGYAKDIVEYLTYRHRRNSILGGGLEYEHGEEAEKGYLAHIRQDGRIPTPADTCGCGTSRFKHRKVANVPRISSLYGNSMRGLFGVGEDLYQLGYDFDSLEANIEAHYCWRWEGKSKAYCKSLTQPKPNDVHSVLARSISNILGRDFARAPAKSVKYGSTYGAQPPRVAQIIGSDLKTGQEVFDAFWKSASPLKKLKDALIRYWETTGGKKFILGIDGRQVPTRAPHAILNSLFQSAGVICAKRAMVIHDRLLKQNNLTVDFFKEDWKIKVYAQQLIAYHDEAQLEVSKNTVRFKMFGTKEEAQTYKDTCTHILSDITKAPDGRYFVAYCKAGALAAQAVQEAGEYYKLNIPLTAGYIIGRNWAECH